MSIVYSKDFGIGDRIRLVVQSVKIGDEQTRVTLRYGWQGPSPSHICNPVSCADCIEQAVTIAEKRFQLEPGSGKAAAIVTNIVNGQSVCDR